MSFDIMEAIENTEYHRVQPSIIVELDVRLILAFSPAIDQTSSVAQSLLRSDSVQTRGTDDLLGGEDERRIPFRSRLSCVGMGL